MAPTAHLTFHVPAPPPLYVGPHPLPPTPKPLLDLTDTLALLPFGGVQVGELQVPILSGTLVHRAFTTTEGTALWWTGYSAPHGPEKGVWTLVLVGGLEADAAVFQRVLMGLPPVVVPDHLGQELSFRRGSGVRGRLGYRNSLVLVDEGTGEVKNVIPVPTPAATPSKLPFPGAPELSSAITNRELPPIPASPKESPPTPTCPPKVTPPPTPGALIARRVDEIAHNLSPEVPSSAGMGVIEWARVERSIGDEYGNPDAAFIRQTEKERQQVDGQSEWEIDDLTKNHVDESEEARRKRGLNELDAVMGFTYADFNVIPAALLPSNMAATTASSPQVTPIAVTSEDLKVPDSERRSSFASVNTTTTTGANDIFETASEGGSSSASDSATIPAHSQIPSIFDVHSRAPSAFEQLAQSHSHPLSASSVADENAVLLEYLNSSTFTVQAVTAREIKERGLVRAEESAGWWEYFGLNKVGEIVSWFTGGWWKSGEEIEEGSKTPTQRKSFIPRFSTFSPLGASLSSLSVASTVTPGIGAAGYTQASRYSVIYYDNEGEERRTYVNAPGGGMW